MAYLLEVNKSSSASFEEYPLADYALKFLQMHITESQERPEVMMMGVHFVRSMAALAVRKYEIGD